MVHENKNKNQQAPAQGAWRAEVVVTRHPALAQLLKELGLAGEDVQVLSHVSDPEQIRGRVVAGVLPLHLAAEAAALIAVDLVLRPEDRGRELTLPELRERLKGVTVYKVTRLESLV